LVALVPLSLVASRKNPQEAHLFLRLAGLGIFALFPLFTHPRETPSKLLVYCCFMRVSGILVSPQSNGASFPFRCPIDAAFACALGVLFFLAEIIHPLFLKPRGVLEFLPLMLISVTCAVGIFLCWCDSAKRLIQECMHAWCGEDGSR
jgi:hypothetical protein